MELKKLNRANEIVNELGRIKRVMPCKTSLIIDKGQATDIINLAKENEEEFCKILLKRIEQLEKEFDEL